MRINIVLLIIALALGTYQTFETRDLHRENQILSEQINSAKQMLLNCGFHLKGGCVA
jgi:hypothetical protein